MSSGSRSLSDNATDALMQAYVACNIAIDALPDLPADIRAAAEEPLRAFCVAVSPALIERYPELEASGPQ